MINFVSKYAQCKTLRHHFTDRRSSEHKIRVYLRLKTEFMNDETKIFDKFVGLGKLIILFSS